MTQTPPSTLPAQDQLKALEQLQELDLKIDAVKKQQVAAPQALKALDDACAKIAAQIAAKHAALGEVDKAKRQAQAAVDLNNDRIARANSKLEAVQNGQEFQAANKEIEQLKKLNASLDEQLKKAAADTESIHAQIEQLQAEAAKAQEDRESQSATIGQHASQLASQITELNDQRRQYLERIDRRVAAQYDRVRAARGGLGIVPALGGRCKGCNMVVAPQLFNEVQRGSAIHACPSCHRILFVPGGKPAGDGPAPQQQM